jgi:hypothetical protein
MGKFTVNGFINRSQQDLFDFLSGPANIPKWDSDFEWAEWTSSGVPGIGSTCRASDKRLGSEKDGSFEIVQWDRPNRYNYKVTERMFRFEHAETIFALKPKDNGIEVTLESQFELVDSLKFAEGFAAKMGKKRIEGNLNAAKRLLEVG